MRPKELQSDDKPSTLRLWKSEFQDYYASNDMDQHKPRVQQNYFMRCISEKLRTKVRHRIVESTPVLDQPPDPNGQVPDSCYKALDEIFKDTYPIVRRRQEFFNYMQSPNQLTTDYMDKLRELFDEAELTQNFDPEDLLTYKAIQGCIVEPARTKFVREATPAFKELEKIARTIEAGENSLRDQPTHGSIAAAQAAKVSGNSKPNKDKSKCKHCNWSNHSSNDCKFKDAVCRKCGEKGHIGSSPLCNSKQSKAEAKKAASTRDDNTAYANSVRVVTEAD